MKKNKIMGMVLCGIAGGLAGYYGGWVCVLAVVLAEFGQSLFSDRY